MAADPDDPLAVPSDPGSRGATTKVDSVRSRASPPMARRHGIVPTTRPLCFRCNGAIPQPPSDTGPGLHAGPDESLGRTSRVGTPCGTPRRPAQSCAGGLPRAVQAGSDERALTSKTTPTP